MSEEYCFGCNRYKRSEVMVDTQSTKKKQCISCVERYNSKLRKQLNDASTKQKTKELKSNPDGYVRGLIRSIGGAA